MNYRTQGHKHRLQIISPTGRRPSPGVSSGIIDFHCHACGTTIQIIRVSRLHRPAQYHIFNKF